MKKLLRFLLIILFVNSFDSTTYAMMVDQKVGQTEQKIPHITAQDPFNLVYFDIPGFLREGFSPESISAAIKQQKFDINARSQRDSFKGWTALHIQIWYFIVKMPTFYLKDFVQPAREEFQEGETIVQILVDAGAQVNAKTIDKSEEWHDLTALEMLAKRGEELEKLKPPLTTPRFLMSRGADTSRIDKELLAKWKS